ncbi:hypothetical protein JT081_02675 [Helicobacter pylori]|nr:hypothetical protein [Helicobacter pylori]
METQNIIVHFLNKRGFGCAVLIGFKISFEIFHKPLTFIIEFRYNNNRLFE